jgi:hypothetical protein
VHIDVGLYQPTYAALRWFFGRVNHRGYVLGADYEHDSAIGVGRAVRQHAEETGTAYVVIPDLSGTAVFAVDSRRQVGRSPASRSIGRSGPGPRQA